MATNAEMLEEARTMYAAYVKAEAIVLTGQSYSIKDRTLTRADLAEIRKGRQEWFTQVQLLSAAPATGTSSGGIRMKRAIIRD